jgi:hypothetical protein
MMTGLIVTLPALIVLLNLALYHLGVRRGFRVATRRRATASRTVVARMLRRLDATERRLRADYETNEDERNEAVGEFCQGVHEAATHATTGCARCAARFDAAWAAASADDLDAFIERQNPRQN